MRPSAVFVCGLNVLLIRAIQYQNWVSKDTYVHAQTQIHEWMCKSAQVYTHAQTLQRMKHLNWKMAHNLNFTIIFKIKFKNWNWNFSILRYLFKKIWFNLEAESVTLYGVESECSVQSSNSALFCLVHFALMPFEKTWTCLPLAMDQLARLNI